MWDTAITTRALELTETLGHQALARESHVQFSLRDVPSEAVILNLSPAASAPNTETQIRLAWGWGLGVRDTHSF